MTPDFWRGRRVLVTGHTGFKGAWLCLWLKQLGAEVCGVALEPDTRPNLYELAGVDQDVSSYILDINDRDGLATVLATWRPQIVLHLAAQALVRRSYREPVETFAANVMGTVNLLDAVRRTPGVEAVVVITTDKVYENREWLWGYREDDRLGGRDPYSASKAAAEIAVNAMRMSYFKVPGAARVGVARAGNVIGGGDFCEDRLVPDIVRGCLGETGEVVLRNPSAVRPWQHVLEPLRGYLMLAERLATSPGGFDEGWNFGPQAEDDRPVIEVAEAMVAALRQGRVRIEQDPNAPHEAHLLRLDCAKARRILGWNPQMDFKASIALTGAWYRAWSLGEDARAFTLGQIADYQQSLAPALGDIS